MWPHQKQKGAVSQCIPISEDAQEISHARSPLRVHWPELVHMPAVESITDKENGVIVLT